MIEVEVLIHNFEDKETKHLGLLQPGYIYEITKERYIFLSSKGIVKKHVKESENQTKSKNK